MPSSTVVLVSSYVDAVARGLDMTTMQCTMKKGKAAAAQQHSLQLLMFPLCLCLSRPSFSFFYAPSSCPFEKMKEKKNLFQDDKLILITAPRFSYLIKYGYKVADNNRLTDMKYFLHPKIWA